MINKNELRIGNFVFDEDNDWCQISVLYSEKKRNFEGYSDDDYIQVEYSNNEDIYSTKVINPIPLTPEIMSKCKNELEMIELRLVQGVCYVDRKGDTITAFNYLHEYQNFYFAMSGEELEINF